MGYTTFEQSESASNTALVNELFECINRNEIAPLSVHPGFDRTRPRIAPMHELFTDWETSELQQIAQNDTVFTHYSIEFTHAGTYAGVAATGRRVTLDCFSVDRVEDGCVMRHHSAANWASVLQQIGAENFSRWPAPVPSTLQNRLLASVDLDSPHDPMLAEIARSHFGTQRANVGLKAAVTSLSDEIRALSTAFPDLQPELVTRVVEGDLVGTRTVLRGTHLGPLYGIAPTGKAVVFDKYCLARIADGMIVEYSGAVGWTSALLKLGLYP